jgi:hypothetical protein
VVVIVECEDVRASVDRTHEECGWLMAALFYGVENCARLPTRG